MFSSSTQTDRGRPPTKRRRAGTATSQNTLITQFTQKPSLADTENCAQNLVLSSTVLSSSPLRDITESSLFNRRHDGRTSAKIEDQEDENLLPSPESTPPSKKFCIKSRELIYRKVGNSLCRRLFMRELTGSNGNNKFYSRHDSAFELRTFYSTKEDVYNIQNVQRPSTPFAITSCRNAPVSVVGDESGVIHFIDTERPTISKPIMKLQCHDNAIFDMNFSQDDMLLATGSGDQSARVFDVQAQKCVAVLDPYDNNSVKQVRFFAGSNSCLAVSTRNGTVALFDMRCSSTESGKFPVASIAKAHNEKGRKSKGMAGKSVTCLEILDNDNNTLLTAGEANGIVKVWDVRKMSSMRQYVAPVFQSSSSESASGITSMAIDRAGSRLWVLSRNSNLYSYGLGGTALACEPLEILAHPRLRVGSFFVKISVTETAPNLSSGYVACGSTDGCVVVFPSSGRARLPLHDKASNRAGGFTFSGGHHSEVTSVSWGSRGELIEISDDCMVRRWQAYQDSSRAEEICKKWQPHGTATEEWHRTDAYAEPLHY
ncbi:WD40-repeat-containing domain protein [Lipomyces japonicus]|uniref:WD40-repeat-containing domain protein n=1 Tax=Lipomyces japonicus TaxID=56871 RepID=UPI0034CD76A3